MLCRVLCASSNGMAGALGENERLRRRIGHIHDASWGRKGLRGHEELRHRPSGKGSTDPTIRWWLKGNERTGSRDLATNAQNVFLTVPNHRSALVPSSRYMPGADSVESFALASIPT